MARSGGYTFWNQHETDAKVLRNATPERRKQLVRQWRRVDSLEFIVILLIIVPFIVGLVGLVIWGFINVFQSGFAWQFLLFNPITFLILIVGGALLAMKRN